MMVPGGTAGACCAVLSSTSGALSSSTIGPSLNPAWAIMLAAVLYGIPTNCGHDVCGAGGRGRHAHQQADTGPCNILRALLRNLCDHGARRNTIRRHLRCLFEFQPQPAYFNRRDSLRLPHHPRDCDALRSKALGHAHAPLTPTTVPGAGDCESTRPAGRSAL